MVTPTSSSSSTKRSRRPTAKAAAGPSSTPSSTSSKKLKLSVRQPAEESSPLARPPQEDVVIDPFITQPTQLINSVSDVSISDVLASDLKPTPFYDAEGRPLEHGGGTGGAKEVVDSDNDVVELATLADVRYKSRWKVMKGKSNVANDMKDYTGNVSWWEEAKEIARGYGGFTSSCNRVALFAWFVGSKKANHLLIDVREEEQFDVVKKQILEWWQHGHRQIYVDATFYLVDEPSPKAAPTGRMSATNRQLADLPAVHQQLKETGAQLVDLRAAWTCELDNCKNSGKHCFWVCSNTASNHYPITTDVGKMWTDDCRKPGRSTVKVPTLEIFNHLAKARDHKRATSHKHRPKVPTGPPQLQQQLPSNITIQNLPPWMWNSGAAAPSTAPSIEPLRIAEELPSSPPTEVVGATRLEQFFEWCKPRKEWKEEDELVDLYEAIALAGFDLRGVAALKQSDWRDLGFKPGYYHRLQRSLLAWRTERKSSPSASSSSSKEVADPAN